MTTLDELHQEWMKGRKYKAAYDAMEEEFALASALIKACIEADKTQEPPKQPRML